MEYSYRVLKINLNRERYLFTATFENFFRLLTTDSIFRETIINIFVNSEFEYVYWQFPVYSSENKVLQAQFDLVKSSPFKSANFRDFENQFVGKNAGDVISFKNISGDTDLISVVPTKFQEINSTLSDIMTFMTNGHPALKSNLLKMIGEKMLKK